MKKFVFTLLLVLGCQISLAQNSAALFDEFRREKNAEYVSASPFLMFIGKMFYPYNDEERGCTDIFSIFFPAEHIKECC